LGSILYKYFNTNLSRWIFEDSKTVTLDSQSFLICSGFILILEYQRFVLQLICVAVHNQNICILLGMAGGWGGLS